MAESTAKPGTAEAAAKDELAALRSELEALRGELSEAKTRIGQRARTAATAARDAARDTAQEKIEAGKARVHDAEEQVEGFVRNRPWAALGIAALVGLVLGLILRR